jgi:hypothetical protein
MMNNQYLFLNERGQIEQRMTPDQLKVWADKLIDKQYYRESTMHWWEIRKTWVEKLNRFIASKDTTWVSIPFENHIEIVKTERLVF